MRFSFSSGDNGQAPGWKLSLLIVVCAVFGCIRISCVAADSILLDFNGGFESNSVGTLGIASFSNAIYATPGSPGIGFLRTGGSDDTIASGNPTTFITDPKPISGQNPSGITVRFAIPVSSISFDILDLDWEPGNFNEVCTVTLMDDSGNVFATTNQASLIFPDAPYGDGSVMPFAFAMENVVQLHVLNKVKSSGARAGFGLDNLQFTPMPVLLSPAKADSNDYVRLSWTDRLTNFVLQTTPFLLPATWTDLSNSVPVSDLSNLVVTVAASNATGFFRLRIP